MRHSLPTAIALVAATAAGTLLAADAATPDTAPTYSSSDELAPTADWNADATCPIGTQLYDTENPDQGDNGVVCRSAILTVF